MRQVIVPPWPGLFSAFGLLGAELTHHFSRTVLRPTHAVGADAIEQVFHELEHVARATLADEGYSDGACRLVRTVDARYMGQSFELRLAVDGATFTPSALADVERRFGDEHERTYGHRADNDPIELVNLRVAATGLGDSPRGQSPVRSVDGVASSSGSRPAYFGPHHGLRNTPVLGRAHVGSVASRGPLIVEEYDATTVVPPDCAVWRDASDNLVIEVNNQPW